MLGESLVALPQGIAITIFGLIIGIPLSVTTLLALVPVVIVVSLFGGAFGVLVLSRLPNRRAASQVFPFVMLPQFFLAGVFNPIDRLPPILDLASHLSPMRYAVDLLRNVYYAINPESVAVPADPLTLNLAVIAIAFVAFIGIGTAFFVRAERNR